MRRGEIPQVKISDIDFATGKIVVYGHKTNRYRTVFLDKGSNILYKAVHVRT